MLDVIIAGGLVFAAIRGFMKGLIVEVISLVAVLIGIVVAIKFSPTISQFLETRVDWSAQVTRVVAYAITFGIALLIVFLAGKFFTKLAEAVALGLLNKILGALFGLLKYGMIISVLLILFNSIHEKVNLVDDKTIQESLFFEHIKNMAPTVFPLLLDLEKEIEINVDLPSL